MSVAPDEIRGIKDQGNFAEPGGAIYYILMISEQNDERSVARDDDSSTEAG